MPEGNELYDVINQRVTPKNIGDSGELRLDFETVDLISNPTRIDFILDIGSNPASPTIPILDRGYTLKGDDTQPISMAFPWFSLGTFLSNGGQIFGIVNSGTVVVGKRALFIKKDIDGVDVTNSQP